jgi:hypothetical protein
VPVRGESGRGQPDAEGDLVTFAHTALWGHLLLGLAWAAAFTAAGLVVFRVKTRSRRQSRPARNERDTRRHHRARDERS